LDDDFIPLAALSRRREKQKKHQKRTKGFELAASIWPQRMEPNPRMLQMRHYLASRAPISAVCFAKSEKEPKFAIR